MDAKSSQKIYVVLNYWYTMRILTLLQMLDSLWHHVLYLQSRGYSLSRHQPRKAFLHSSL